MNKEYMHTTKAHFSSFVFSCILTLKSKIYSMRIEKDRAHVPSPSSMFSILVGLLVMFFLGLQDELMQQHFVAKGGQSGKIQ
jgi:hypothetical protein